MDPYHILPLIITIDNYNYHIITIITIEPNKSVDSLILPYLSKLPSDLWEQSQEHIALLGKCLTGPEKQSYEVIRSLDGGRFRACACVGSAKKT